MNFMVYVNPGRKPWIFATEAEARASANHVFQSTGRIVAIESTAKKATHEFTLS